MPTSPEQEPFNSEDAINEVLRILGLPDTPKPQRLLEANEFSRRTLSISRKFPLIINEISYQLRLNNHNGRDSIPLFTNATIDRQGTRLVASIRDAQIPTEIGGGSVTFVHEDPRESLWAHALHFNSVNSLHLGVLGDPQYLDAARQLIAAYPERRNDFYTHYFFDSRGNCIKAYPLPANFDALGPYFRLPESSIKYTKPPLSLQDVGYCEAAIQSLLDRLYLEI